MQADCSAAQLHFEGFGKRQVVGAFDGGAVTSNAGAILLREADRALGLTAKVARCFSDGRAAELVVHRLETLVAQRVHAIALGYEDINDHDELRHDPVLGLLSDTLEPKRADVAPLAGKSTLNRLEHGLKSAMSRYHKISVIDAAMEEVFLELYAAAHKSAPKRIILDLDATDDPLHGRQEGRFFHGYYRCYCYLPLYIFDGRHLLVAKLRKANIDAAAGAQEEIARIVSHVRQAWPQVEIWLRADSGFARQELMSWCEVNRVEYVFGLARNQRLEPMIASELAEAKATFAATARPARSFKELEYRTRDSWSRSRRVVAKAEHLEKGANPRFIVTSLSVEQIGGQELYETIYCQRGETLLACPYRSSCSGAPLAAESPFSVSYWMQTRGERFPVLNPSSLRSGNFAAAAASIGYAAIRLRSDTCARVTSAKRQFDWHAPALRSLRSTPPAPTTARRWRTD